MRGQGIQGPIGILILLYWEIFETSSPRQRPNPSRICPRDAARRHGAGFVLATVAAESLTTAAPPLQFFRKVEGEMQGRGKPLPCM